MSIRDGLRAAGLAGSAVLAAASLACSFSYSSKSLSDSSESSSESSSSSSPGSNETNYRNDVESYTESYALSGGGPAAFLSGIADLARKRGISDWEANDNTWRGIGRGLGRTKIEDEELGPYEQNWAGGDPSKVSLIRKGFDEER